MSHKQKTAPGVRARSGLKKDRNADKNDQLNNIITNKSKHRSTRRQRLAHAAASDAFGPRWHGWRLWDGFVDVTPAQLKSKRARAGFVEARP